MKTAKNHCNIELMPLGKIIHQSKKNGHLIYKTAVKNQYRDEILYSYRNTNIFFNYGEEQIDEYDCYDYSADDLNKYTRKYPLEPLMYSRLFISCHIEPKNNSFHLLNYGFIYNNYSDNLLPNSVNGKNSKKIKLNHTSITKSLDDFFNENPKAEIFSPIINISELNPHLKERISDDDCQTDNDRRKNFFKNHGFIILDRYDYRNTFEVIEASIFSNDIWRFLHERRDLYYIYTNKELFKKRPK